MKKLIIIIIILTNNNTSFSQKLCKRDIFNYITTRWSSVHIKKTKETIAIDSQFLSKSNYYYIDEKPYDSIRGIKKINSIDKNDLILVNFSLYTQYPDFGVRIIINTKSGNTKSFKKFDYDNIVNTGFSIRKSSLIDSVYGSGNCALIINDTLIEPFKVRSIFFSITYKEIKYIGYTTGYQHSIYGEDSKNGVIYIWTKKKDE